MSRSRAAALGLAALVLLGPAAGRTVSPEDVNVFIGTGGSGFGVGSAFPGPALPFGLARPGPDTARNETSVSFYHCGGYYHGDNQVRGFSHTRLSGIGVTEYGNLLLMPVMPGKKDYSKESAYRSRFDHASEDAAPGYYAVTLADSGIRAELTATRHCGLHRYTFPASPGAVIINARHALTKDGVCEAEIEFDENRGEVFGEILNCGSLTKRNGGVEIFFAVKFGSVKPKKCAGEGTRAPREESGVVCVEVDAKLVEVAVGLSFIGVEQARRHLDEEVGNRSFDAVREAARSEWERELGVIEVTGGTPDQRAIFATALYHSLLMPTDFTEARGLYRGFDEKTHRAEGFTYYTDFSLWDTFRTLHPLLTLIAPGRSADMMRSLTLMAEQGGWLPRWPTAYRYTNCMIGASADNVIADAYLKGIRGFDAERAYAAMRDAAMNPVPPGADYEGRVGLDDYIKLGYVPSDRHGRSASGTIEMSYNDFCVAQMARALGKDDDYRMFMERSQNWRNLWDGKTGFLRGKKSDGSRERPFLPWAWTDYYVEGNARQWLWAPVHDPEGMIELMGGPENFTRRLNDFFERSAARPDTFLWDNFYWHGNEPDVHAAYLFNYAGRPDLTRRWVRWVMDTKYHNAPAGLDGNDDGGALSAWYIFSALGFYPVTGTDTYLAGAPLFPKAVVHLPGGDLTVRSTLDPKSFSQATRVTVNGRVLSDPWFQHADIAHGGEIVFETAPR